MKDFQALKLLGKGAFGAVWLVRKKATGDLYAMKMVDSSKGVKFLFNAFLNQISLEYSQKPSEGIEK